MQLTGQTRFRASKVFNKLILQVQVGQPFNIGNDTELRHFWRDARVEDLAQLQHMVYSRIDVHLPDVTVEGADAEPELIGEVPRGQTRKPN